MLKFTVNNNREIRVEQPDADCAVKVSKLNKDGIEENHEYITPGDFVMLLNYYQYIKDNNIHCDFINPQGTK